MGVHNWSKQLAGIFHDFHQTWSTLIRDSLNDGILPSDMYALVEQYGSKGGRKRVSPDVITLKRSERGDQHGGLMLKAPPKKESASGELAHYLRKKNLIAVRHSSDDEVVAMIEIISPGNKSGPQALANTVEKLTDLIQRDIHLLVIDLFPPKPSVPQSLHQTLWESWNGEDDEFETGPADKPLGVMAYEADEGEIRGFVDWFAVGDPVPEGILFLEPDGCVTIPLNDLYEQAWKAVPKRWRDVIEPPISEAR